MPALTSPPLPLQTPLRRVLCVTAMAWGLAAYRPRRRAVRISLRLPTAQ
ncbi:hypothetical protein [Acidovorax sp. M2(2025)]